jgi:hypothetical protein|tara:strand:+ start:1083 stop:1640 length:558 start_codon:yes stop_codon:yes gene_type:complete
MAEFWSNPGLEPKRQYRWLFSFGNKGGSGKGDLPAYICKKVDKPTFQVTESEHTFLNHKFYYPGRVEWQEVSITIVDPIDLDAANALQEIIKDAGYFPPGGMGVDLTPDMLQTISKKKFTQDVMGFAKISQLDAEGDTRESWVLHNVWIKSVDFGTLDYSADELVEITLQLRYDYAIQHQGPVTR